MSRQSQEEVAAAARRRLELLGRELEQAGLRRLDEPEPEAEPVAAAADTAPLEVADPAPLAPVGRHARTRRDPAWARLHAWAADQVPDTLHGRVALTAGPLLVVVVLAVVALGGAAVLVLRSGGGAEALPAGSGAAPPAASPLVPLASGAAASGAATGAAGATASPGGPPASGAVGAASGEVTVDVAGRVRRPGVATLPAGSRVVDALRRAGGARPGVDLTSLNLARVLVDGEQLLVGRAAPAASGPGGAAAAAAGAAPAPTGALVSLNTATAEQLDTLPGVGPVTAAAILEWRSAHGAFSSVDELLEVDGIGDKTLADLAPHVTL
ncbi:competence protein ComEA [Nocardioides scoriae]|uniref:Competence protein ComEA n=1 Tax=Nocardioides scoriae TaxID=642780 RepID=A0A1H1LY82_9ACTN|nr:ComEA family DNA-binding protein [Nocardioides scoriae]SDR79554.1 competence protein ComEA [Nocardioides scoriae]